MAGGKFVVVSGQIPYVESAKFVPGVQFWALNCAENSKIEQK
jgi:hypothetical protein